jgi:guanylate kinase
MKREAMLILVGPSAVGKTTVADELIESGEFSLTRSLTTRAPRGDGHDDEYVYTDRAGFLRELDSGRVLEHTEYLGTLYGTPLSEIERVISEGRVPLLILDINGAEALSRIKGEISPCIIYLTEDESVLKSRLEARYLLSAEKDIEKYESRMRRNSWEKENLPSLSHLFYRIIKGAASPSLTAKAVRCAFSDFVENLEK